MAVGRLGADPAALALAEQIGLRALAAEGHAEIVYAPPLIEGATVYDCFAGTGSMGLECLSRGAVSATFFEADRSALCGKAPRRGPAGS